MSAVLSAKAICERSLRAIGEFPVTEPAADGEKLREAMTWLDLIMAQEAGAGVLFFMVEKTISMPIENGTTSYDLVGELGSSLPPDGLQYVRNAWIRDGAGNRYPCEIVTRDKFEAVPRANAVGRPTMVHIDRLDAPTARIYPTPASDDPTSYFLDLETQSYAPNVAPAGVTGTTPQGAILTRFRVAWQRYLILCLNVDLASGPIVKLPQSSVDNWKVERTGAKNALAAYENREHESTPPVVDAWGGDSGDPFGCDMLPGR
jgi:hypothetical protein